MCAEDLPCKGKAIVNDVRMFLFLRSPPCSEEHAYARRNVMWIQVMPTPSGLAELAQTSGREGFHHCRRGACGNGGPRLPAGTCPWGDGVLPQTAVGEGQKLHRRAVNRSWLSHLIRHSCLILSPPLTSISCAKIPDFFFPFPFCRCWNMI